MKKEKQYNTKCPCGAEAEVLRPTLKKAKRQLCRDCFEKEKGWGQYSQQVPAVDWKKRLRLLPQLYKASKADIIAIEQFILEEIAKARSEGLNLRKEYNDPQLLKQIRENCPMGVSQWRNHGIKYNYDKYFGIDWGDKNCECDNPKPNKIINIGEAEGHYFRCQNCKGRIWS